MRGNVLKACSPAKSRTLWHTKAIYVVFSCELSRSLLIQLAQGHVNDTSVNASDHHQNQTIKSDIFYFKRFLPTNRS